MNDENIVALYWQRDERAIEETAEKYGAYCFGIAHQLLGNTLDAEECVNDTYQAAWNSIPPNRPQVLSTYLGKITRRISLKVWRGRDAQKRGCGETALSLEELRECIPDSREVDAELSARELTNIINAFLLELPIQERRVFIRRYWHGFSIKEICGQFGFSKSKAESMLHRTRKKLRKRLEKEGYL